MKISIDTYLLRTRFGDEKAFEMLSEAGFEAVDYSFFWISESEYNMLDDNYVSYAHKVKDLLKKYNLECNQAHAPFGLIYTDELTVNNPKYIDIVRSIEAASIIGAKSIVIHGIYVPEGDDFEALNIPYFKSLEPYAKRFGIKLAIENIFAFDKKRNNLIGVYGKESDKLPEFIEKLDSDCFVACIDIGHTALTGKEPEEVIMTMKDKNLLKCLRVQDTDYASDRHVLPFMGDLNWDNITKALVDVGYDGDISLEVFQYLKRHNIDFLPEALRYAAKTAKYIVEKINRLR